MGYKNADKKRPRFATGPKGFLNPVVTKESEETT